MKFEQATEIPAETELQVDVCVIGSGAAGMTLALELNGKGLRVLMLEAGDLNQDRALEEECFELEHLGLPYRNPLPGRGRWFGGSTNLWFGRIARPDPIDFELRPWVQHATPWPVTLESLEANILRAAGHLKVEHFDKIQGKNWPNRSAMLELEDKGTLTLNPFLWAGMISMSKYYARVLQESPNVRVLLNATVTRMVATADSAQVDVAEVCGPRGNRFVVRARKFVLAAGGLENARLLFASPDVQGTPLGNKTDRLGRYYMDHPRSDNSATIDLRGLSSSQLEAIKLLNEKGDSPFGKSQFRICFTADVQRREGLLNHGLHGYLVSDVHQSEAYLSTKRLLGRLRGRPSKEGLGRDLFQSLVGAPGLVRHGVEKTLGQTKPTHLMVVDQMEQEPDPESRLTVDRDKKDRFGMPRLQLDWRIGESTFRSRARLHELFRDALGAAGSRAFRSNILEFPEQGRDLLDMKHPAGTTRMAASARDGVVDANCCVHGVDNLFVVGGSTFPTTGHFNPTLLIVAFATRLADHLRQQLGT